MRGKKRGDQKSYFLNRDYIYLGKIATVKAKFYFKLEQNSIYIDLNFENRVIRNTRVHSVA